MHRTEKILLILTMLVIIGIGACAYALYARIFPDYTERLEKIPSDGAGE